MATTIEISSVEDLEAILHQLDPRAPLLFAYSGTGDLTEAAILYRRLQILVKSSHGHWEVEKRGLQILSRAGEHCEKLDLLEIQLQLVEMDLKDGIAMNKMRFHGVRSTANEVVSSAHPSSSLAILDCITIEAQRLARVTKALGFGALDQDLPELMQEDLEWLFAGDNGTGAKYSIGAVDGSADELEPLNLDDKCRAVKIDGADGEAQLDNVEGSNCNEPAQPEPSDDDAVSAYHRWALRQEQVVVGLLTSKVAKIRGAIAAAKKTSSFL